MFSLIRSNLGGRKSPTLAAALWVVVVGLRPAAANFALPADATVVSSGWDRIELDIGFEDAEDSRNPPERECFLAFPAREYSWRPSYLECAVFDEKGRLIKDGYVPTGEEVDETHLQSAVRVSSGFCHDRIVARLGFVPVLRPLTGTAGEIFNLRRLRIVIEFKGGMLAGYESLTERARKDPLGFEPLFQSLLINYDSSLSFRVRETNPRERGGEFYGAVAEAATRGGVWKFPVSGSGIHRIDAQTLSHAGLNLARTARASLRLWREGQEVPYFLFPEEDGEVLPIDFSLFFFDDGEGTDYSEQQIYWITSGSGQAQTTPRIVCGCPSPATSYMAFREVQTLGKLSVMPASQRPFAGVWFRDVMIGKRPREYSFDLPAATGEMVDLHVGFRNALHDDLVVVASVNGASAASIRVEALAGSSGPIELDFSVPREKVGESGNKLSLRIVNEHEPPPIGYWEGLYVEELEVSHWREPRAFDRKLRLNLPEDASGCVRIQPTGLDDGRILGFQVAPRFQVLTDLPERVSEGVALPVEGGSVFEFLHPIAALVVEDVTRFEGLKLHGEENRGNYVVIGPRKFEDALVSLLEFRQKQGYVTHFVDIQAVYDEFSFGIPNPHAIRDFIRYALSKWSHPAPSSVLLVGDAFWDYRNRTGSVSPNIIPTYIPPDNLKSTGSDIWFTLTTGTSSANPKDLPDVFLARIPARTEEEVRTAVAKFIAYETDSELGPWRARVFLASDHGFQQHSESVAEDTVPRWAAPDYFRYGDFPLEDHYRVQLLRPESKGYTKTSPRATAELVRGINQGCLLWDYFGHGGAFVLSNSDLFIGNDRYDTDVLRLSNRRRLPLFCSLSCLTGLFYTTGPWEYCLGESLLFTPNGAIATYTPCGFGSAAGEEHLSKRIKRGVYTIPGARLGEIICRAQTAGYLSGGLDGLLPQFMLFGDPATRLAVPSQNLEVRIAAQQDTAEGRRVKLSFACQDIPYGTAEIKVYDPGRREELWQSEATEFSTSAKGLELLLPRVKPDDEGIIQVYAWNPAVGSDAAGWTRMPAVSAKVSILPDLCYLKKDATRLQGRLALQNQTSREEKEVLLSVLVDDRLIFQEPVGPFGPKQRLLHPVQVPVQAGNRRALFVLRTESAEMDRFLFAFAVPEVGRDPVPEIVSGTLLVRPSSSILGKTLDQDGPLPPGIKAEIIAEVVNPSTVESFASKVDYECQNADSPSQANIPVLPAGQTTRLATPWTIPPPGEYALALTVYSASVEAGTPVQVVEKIIRVGEYPDLAIAENGFRAEPESPVEGESVRFHIRFQNQGKTPAAEFGLRIYELRPDGTEELLRNLGDAVPIIQWPRFMNALKPGESGELTIVWHPSRNIGMHRFIVALDDASEVPESNEENNRQTLTMNFSPGLNHLREERQDAWVQLEFDSAAEINEDIERFLDRQLDRFEGDRTWLDYDWFADRGFSSLVSGDLERAAEVLGWGIELLPTYAANYYLEACVELRQGRLAAAKQTFQKLEQERSFDHYWIKQLGEKDPLYQTAFESFESGQLARAQRALEECVEQTPVNSNAWWLLYRVRSESGDARGALTALRRYVDARLPSQLHGIPWYEAMHNTLAFDLNRPSAAREVVEEAIATYPDDARFHFLIPYLDYIEGRPPNEIRDRIRETLSKMRTLRGIIAGIRLLLVRLDLDLNDEESLIGDYGSFVFHSSKTSSRSGFRSWPRVTPSKWETNPELRVFSEPPTNQLPEKMIALRLEKSETAEPAEVPAPATVELPLTVTLDLGSPRTIDACLIDADESAAGELLITLSRSADNGSDREKVGTGVPLPGSSLVAARFPPTRSRFWHVHFESGSGQPVLRLRDLSLMEKRPEPAGSTE